jgi:hypothetical protein
MLHIIRRFPPGARLALFILSAAALAAGVYLLVG